MLKSLTPKWELNKSPLYRHIPTKEVDKTLGPKFQKAIIQSITADNDTAFLKSSPELQEVIRKMEIAVLKRKDYPDFKQGSSLWNCSIFFFTFS